MYNNIHFGFNWCVASHLCSTQINAKSSKSRKFVCYEPLLKFPEHQFLCSVSVRGPEQAEHRACSVHSQAWSRIVPMISSSFLIPKEFVNLAIITYILSATLRL